MSPRTEGSPEDAPLDFRRMARDGGPIAAACAAVVTAIGGWTTARDLTTEVRSLRDAVTRLEVKASAAEPFESRLRAVEVELAALKAHTGAGK